MHILSYDKVKQYDLTSNVQYYVPYLSALQIYLRRAQAFSQVEGVYSMGSFLF